MRVVETELCAFSPEAVEMAARCGVVRAELCTAPTEDGTTPSAGAIERAAAVGGIELSVMIRPRGGDFVYSDGEFATMERDLKFARELGADCVVFGLLTPDGEVDVPRTKRLLELAGGLETTFHKAFDAAADPFRALEDIIAAGCTRILTSGQGRTALEGVPVLRELVKRAAGRIEIMVGGGVNPGNAAELAETGVDALHFSARGGCGYPHFAQPDPQMPQPNEEFIRRMVEIARSVDHDTISR